jgi:hypothetical protein
MARGAGHYRSALIIGLHNGQYMHFRIKQDREFGTAT